MRRFFIVFVLLTTLVAQVPAGYAQTSSSSRRATSAPAASSSSRKAAEGITAAQLSDYLSFVAADEMEGRDTPSRGLDLTAKFIATLLARWGVKPAGDNGTYFQKIVMQRARIEANGTRAEINGQAYNYGQDFLAIPQAGTASGPLIYVGHGWLVKQKNIDAYSGLNVKDKLVVVSGGLPKGVTFSDLDRGKQGLDWMQPEEYAQKMGALGIVELPDSQTIANWERIHRNQQTGGSIVVAKFQPPATKTLPAIMLSQKMADVLFDGEKHSAVEIVQSKSASEPIAAFDLNPNKKVSMTIAGQPATLSTQNVVGVIEGSDSVLKNEYVAVGAHYDHVGAGPPGGNGRFAVPPGGDRSDTIYNGADDDGSGTVSLLAMAEALSRAARRPKRSILFVWHCGEEKGLWGSEYFVQYPTVPLDKIVAQFNIDMIGRSKAAGDTTPANRALTGPNEIYVIGSKMMSTELGELSERVNQSYLNLSFNYKYDEPTDPNRFFFRSDHYNYAQKGIPIIFYFDGVHEDYHRPDDEVAKIDYEKMQKVARTIFVTLWETADLKTRPLVDKKLPTELTGQ
jgi:hypothetical protein